MKIGFVGMSHLGIVMATACASKGYRTYCFDNNKELLNDLRDGNLPILEPNLREQMILLSDKLSFNFDISEVRECDIVFVSLDIETNIENESNLAPIEDCIKLILKYLEIRATLVILSQIPPGFCRKIQTNPGINIYYQVETLVFGNALERALYPERIIVGLADIPNQINSSYLEFLRTFNCPVVKMTYESAELSKLSINLFLTASLSTANSLAEIARNINADWDDIKSALKLDARIGPNSYISPGLGISGGNIERDLQNITNLATQFDCHSGVFESFKNASTYYKLWPSMVLKTIRPPILPKELICVWGLTYKKNTHSVKNSPAIANILALKDEYRIRVYDPVANLPNNLMELCDFETNFSQSLNDCSALLILTDWEMFSSNLSESLIYQLSKIDIIDPYGMLKKYVNKIGKHYRL